VKKEEKNPQTLNRP